MNKIEVDPISYDIGEKGSLTLRENGKLLARLEFEIQTGENHGALVSSSSEIKITNVETERDMFKISNGKFYGDPEKYKRFMSDVIPQIIGFPALQRELKKYI